LEDAESAIEGAALMEVVAEALRAGPGTSQWEVALREVGQARGASGGDVRAEMELLARIRRELAAGKSWREISAGAGFTRKLMGRIEAEGGRKEGRPTSWAGWIAGLALLVLAGIGVYAAVEASRSSPVEKGVTAESQALAFASPRVVWDFGMPWPGRTSIQGALKLDASGDGLRVAAGKVGNVRLGGAALLEVPLEDGVVEVTMEVPQNLTWNVAAQVFLTNTKVLDAQTAVSEGEWVLQVDKGGAKVVTAGLDVATPAAVKRDADGVVIYRITLDHGRAVVESAGEKIWEGELGLAEGKERFVGVRFLARGDVAAAGVPTMKLLRVLGGR
jgi:hypothetical protein